MSKLYFHEFVSFPFTMLLALIYIAILNVTMQTKQNNYLCIDH